MSRRINVAILGAGNIARAMAEAVNGIPEEQRLNQCHFPRLFI